MKMMFKQILAVFLCVLMLCGAVPFGVFAAQDALEITESETDPADETGTQEDASVELPERFDLVRYRRFLVVPPDSRLTFHTTASAPEGYYIA